ncbi:MAG TPA: hypothetical protein VIH11_04780 [Gemmatimonadaceae bacterium]|nr:hypothetical protein [Gemmatimonadaceae bacterium]
MPHGRVLRFIALAVLVLAAACGRVWSIHPLFQKEQLVVERALVGAWADSAKPRGDRWVVLPGDEPSHAWLLAIADSALARRLEAVDFVLLSASDSAFNARARRDPALRTRRARDSAAVRRLESDAGGPRVFELRLGRLDGVLFADISPASLDDAPPHLGRTLLIPAHWFWRVSLEGERVRVTPLNEEWLVAKIDSGRVGIAHEKENDDLVLTGTTSELQALVSKYARDSAAFPRKTEIVLTRAAR